MKSRPLVTIVVLAVAISVVLLLRPRSTPATLTYDSFTEQIMASPITVMAPEPVAREAATVVFEVFRDVDVIMSEWKPRSAISAINDAAGRQPVVVPEDLRALIGRGLEIGAMTDGAFDVTWAALWGLWSFKTRPSSLPDPAEIERRLALIDFRGVAIDDRAGTVFLPEEGMVLGLGGIAKGHALDRAAAALRARGIDSFLISAAGQVMLHGRHDERPWRVGIRDPRGAVGDCFTFLELTDVSVSTSGDYERYFMHEGVRYHHILDPRTGRPARGVRSATVVTADATLGDALSTALMIMGVERSMVLVESLASVDAVLVDENGVVHVSSGLEGRLHNVHAPAS